VGVRQLKTINDSRKKTEEETLCITFDL